jgi:hypothetical protein
VTKKSSASYLIARKSVALSIKPHISIPTAVWQGKAISSYDSSLVYVFPLNSLIYLSPLPILPEPTTLSVIKILKVKDPILMDVVIKVN